MLFQGLLFALKRGDLGKQVGNAVGADWVHDLGNHTRRGFLRCDGLVVGGLIPLATPIRQELLAELVTAGNTEELLIVTLDTGTVAVDLKMSHRFLS